MKIILMAVTMFVSVASAQVSCPNGFTTSGACAVGIIKGGLAFQVNGSQGSVKPDLSGSSVNLIPTGNTHAALSMNYQTQVNVQAFTATFTFVPNGQNVALIIQNSNNNPTFNGAVFSAGAGCEADFFQAFSQPSPPNNVFALELDSYSPLTLGGSFSYSSVQTYTSGTSPCLPNDSGNNYPTTSKISTSPVNLTKGTQNTTTGDTYSAVVTYSGTTLTLALSDVTHPAGTFTHSWTGINIPSAVGGNTAWVGLGGATGLTSNSPLLVSSFVYSVGSVPTPPANPTFSPAAGTYISAQTVTIADATSGAAIYYTTDGSVPTTGSTQYTEPITLGTSTTLSAAAFVAGAHSGTSTAVYTINIPPPPVTLAIPAQSIPLSITTAGTPITGTITIPAQTVTLPQP